MRLSLRRFTPQSMLRSVLGLSLIALGTFRIVSGRGVPGHFWLTFFNQWGLVLLGILLLLGIFVRFNRTFYFLFGALIFELLIEEGLLTPLIAQRIATVVMMSLVGYFFYKLVRLSLLAKKDTAKRKAHRTDFGYVNNQHLLPVDSPYHSHLENEEFLLRDMSKSHNNSLVGYEGCWGTRWHFGPLWFENFFGDLEPPHGHDGPLRAVVWQPMRDVAASAGWKHTRLLKYNHMTGFATLGRADYWNNWSEHARRGRNKWLKVQEQWELYHPTGTEFLAAYRRSDQGFLLKFYFVNLIKQLLLTHRETLVFWGLRRIGSPSMAAGFVAHDIPEAKQSRHIASFADKAVEAPLGIALMDAWFADALIKGFIYLDFGVFWMPGDPDSWKGFSRFKGQFGITYIQYPAARLRRAGSFRFFLRR